MTKFIRVKGNIPVEYFYTAGFVGERFFRGIRDKEKLSGTACTKCKIVYLPPRLYCERCFKTLEKWKPIPKKGSIYTFTISNEGNEKIPKIEPTIWAFITFKGITGGLIHKIGEVKPDEVKIGLTVVPVFEEAEKRTGSILDIKYFKPV